MQDMDDSRLLEYHTHMELNGKMEKSLFCQLYSCFGILPTLLLIAFVECIIIVNSLGMYSMV